MAKGLCGTHYRRWRASGDPDGGRIVEPGATLLEKATNKFLRGIRKLDSGCWTCDTAQATKKGYLHLTVKIDRVEMTVKVHRFSYEHHRGPIPAGKLICHSCDMRWCCNPDHLFPGTQSDNMQDMVRKGRGLVGVKSARTKFTEADILAIYQDIDRGISREAIARKFGVAAVTISHIATGRNWKHLYQRHRLGAPE